MKKVINNAVYDTATAHFIGGVSGGGESPRDFGYWQESLYRTKSGKYFLHGEGHGNSRYGKWTGNTGGWGEVIRAYTLSEAMAWTAEHLDGDAYIAEFGEPDESGDKSDLTINVSPAFRARLETLKRESGKSISSIIEGLLGYER